MLFPLPGRGFESDVLGDIAMIRLGQAGVAPSQNGAAILCGSSTVSGQFVWSEKVVARTRSPTNFLLSGSPSKPDSTPIIYLLRIKIYEACGSTPLPDIVHHPR
jgi:hypothetical protein